MPRRGGKHRSRARVVSILLTYKHDSLGRMAQRSLRPPLGTMASNSSRPSPPPVGTVLSRPDSSAQFTTESLSTANPPTLLISSCYRSSATTALFHASLGTSSAMRIAEKARQLRDVLEV